MRRKVLWERKEKNKGPLLLDDALLLKGDKRQCFFVSKEENLSHDPYADFLSVCYFDKSLLLTMNQRFSSSLFFSRDCRPACFDTIDPFVSHMAA